MEEGKNRVTYKNKDKTISIRITARENELLEAITKEFDMSKSKIIRQAVNQYFLQKQSMDKLLISKPHVRLIFDEMSENTIEKFAKQVFQTQLSDDRIDKYFIKSTDSARKQFEHHIEFLSNYVYQDTAQKWFEQTYYKFEKYQIIFSGRHKLGLNFSKFFSKLFHQYAHNFGFSVTKNLLKENTILLKFQENVD